MPILVYILALATFAVGTQTYVFSGLLNELAHDLGVSVSLAGQLITAYAITSAIFAPFIINLFSKIDRRLLLLITMWALVLVNFTTAFVPNFESLFIARILLALIASVVFPIAGAIAAESVPVNQQGKALGIVLSGLTLSFIVGIPLGTVIGGYFGWRSTFMFAGLIALLVIPLLTKYVPSSRSELSNTFSNFRVIRIPGVGISLVLSGLSFAASYVVYAYIGPVVEILTGFNGAAVGALQVFVGVGSVAGILLGIHLADKWPYVPSLTLLFTALISAQLLYSVWFLLPYSGLAKMAIPLGATIFIASSVLFALGPLIEKALVQASPNHSALTLAMNTSMIYLGQGLGAVVGGVTINVNGFSILGFVGAIIAITTLLLLIVSYRQLSSPALNSEN